MVKVANANGSPSKQRKNYKSSTKNNIHHFGVIIYKILWARVKQGILSE